MMPPEHIPARKGFDEQWRFDPPEPVEIFLAIHDATAEAQRTLAAIPADILDPALEVMPDPVIVGPDEKLVRFLVFFEPGDRFPARFARSEGDNPEVDPYRTAWVRLGTLRTLFGGAARAGQGPGVVSRFAELFLGWPVGSIDRAISVSLANG